MYELIANLIPLTETFTKLRTNGLFNFLKHLGSLACLPNFANFAHPDMYPPVAPNAAPVATIPAKCHQFNERIPNQYSTKPERSLISFSFLTIFLS